jgi:SCP-2 sterol transfer family
MPPAANVSPAQLRRLHDLLRGLPKDASTNALYNGVCQVELSDPSCVFHFVFSRGTAEIVEGKHDSPVATVALKFDVFLDMATGRVDTRNIRTSGERLLAMKAFMFLNQPLEGTLDGYRRTAMCDHLRLLNASIRINE